MLTLMRNILRNKFIGGILFALIIISMGVWGITDIFTNNLGSQAVKAGERGFSMQEFDVRVEQFLQRQRRQENNTIVTRRDAVEQGAVDQLFAVESARTARLGYAESIGATASVAATTEDISTTEVFADPITGTFSRSEYERVLRSNQLTPASYQQNLRDSLTISIIEEAVSSAIIPPDTLIQLQARYFAETRELTWFAVSASDVGELPPATDEELDAFYQSQLQAFSIPERRALSILSISADDFLHRVNISTEDLRAIYEAQKVQRFSGPESRRFTEVVTRSEAAARTALGRLAVGEAATDFTDEDVGSAISRTALRSEIANEDVAEALFSPNERPGGVVGPVQAGNVWIVARLDEIIPGTPIPFEEVSELIREESARAEATNLLTQAEDGLFQQIGMGLTLSEIGDELGAPVITYLPVTQNGQLEDGRRLSAQLLIPELMQAAFDGRVDQVTDPVEANGRVYLVEVQETLPPRTPELSEIRDRVEAAFNSTRTGESLAGFAGDLVAQIEAGERTMADIAQALGSDLMQTAQPISRAENEGAAPQALLNPAFTAIEGDIFTAQTRGDEIVIARLDSINPPDPVEIQVLSSFVGAQIEQSLRNDLMTAMETAFRDDLDFESNPLALEAYKQQILDQQ